MTHRVHVRLTGEGIADVKNLRKNVVEECKRIGGGRVLGWIRNNKDASVELLAEGEDEAVLRQVAAFAVTEAERWLALVVAVETVASTAGAAKLKPFDVGHSGSPA